MDAKKHARLLLRSLDSSKLTPGNCHGGSIVQKTVRFVLPFLLVCQGTVWATPPSPPRLTVGEIQVETTDIFSRAEIGQSSAPLRFLRSVMNGVHVDTRAFVLRRELLFRTGERYDPALLAETARNLRRLGYLNRVSVTPIDTLSNGAVTIKVSAREAWTLKTQFALSVASGGSSRWNALLSDNNFLGFGTMIGAGLGQTEDSDFQSLLYRDRRLLGSSWRLYGAYFNRGDGHVATVDLFRPFHALDDQWGISFSAWDQRFDSRYYLSTASPAGPGMPNGQSLYGLVPHTARGVQIGGRIRTFAGGGRRIWRLGLGARVREMDFDLDAPHIQLSDGRFVDLGYLEQGATPANRVQGTGFYPFLVLKSVGRNWATTSFMLQYGQVEDVPLDVDFEIRLGPRWMNGRAVADDGLPWRTEFSLRDWSRLAGGFWLVTCDGVTIFGAPSERTTRILANAGWFRRHGNGAYPRVTRLVLEAGYGDELVGTEAFLLGLRRGIRTLGYDKKAGDRLWRWNLEHGKVLPFELLGLFQTGVAAFYSGGAAWWHDERQGSGEPRHEVGFGIRLGPTRAASGEPARLDISWSLDGAEGPVITAATRGLF